MPSMPKTRPRRRRTRGVIAGLAATAAMIATTPMSAALADNHDRGWMNTALAPDQRAALLLERMTLEEKVELMTGDQGDAPSAFYNGPITRLGIPELRMADAGAGIGPRGWTLPGTGSTATAMPAGIALGSTWDRDLTRTYAQTVTDEAKATGHAMLLGPGGDVIRNPFWGRAAETPSEDPFLISEITTPFVQQVQSQNVIANLKHYAGYQQEVNRGVGQNSIIDDRTMMEVYTYPYKKAIEQADLGSTMCSFNKVNGEYACESDYALQTVLRQRLGFKGFVISDFGAIHSTAPSVEAGADMVTGIEDDFYGPVLLAAVRNGGVSEALVDRSVLRILRTMFAVGVFDNTYAMTSIPVAEHRAVAREVQEDAVTLLRNRGVLPLSDQRRLRSIAVIGADANIPASIGGSARVAPTAQVSLVDALETRGDEEGVNVRWVRGNDPVHGSNMIETADMTAVPSSVLTPESGRGTGLTARYWGNSTFQGQAEVTRVEQQVAYDVGFTGGTGGFGPGYVSQVPATPGVGGPSGENQSAVYTGFITAPTNGAYRLGLTGWGDASLFVDGELVVQNNGTRGRWVEDASVQLRAGQRVSIRVVYSSRELVPLQPGTLLMQWAPPADAQEPALREAVAAADDADVAVVYLRTYESEERDRVSLKLPQNADRLVRAVSDANPNTVVVVASGGPPTMPWRNRVNAIVQNWYGGQEEGDALTRILFGDEDPSGHLPVTLPRSEDELGPGQDNPWSTIDDLDVEFSEGLNVGYRGYLAEGITPAFPFGHGLSYTDFRFDRLRTNGLNATGGNATGRVRVRVANTGDRAGTEVVQVYAGPLPGIASPRKLVGFAKVELDAGERADVVIDIDRQDLSYWDDSRDRWVTPRGNVPIYVGKSATEVEVSAQIRVQ